MEQIYYCPLCGGPHSVEVRSIDLEKYIREGWPAQCAFPSPFYTATEREQIISGFCPTCQEKVFQETS